MGVYEFGLKMLKAEFRQCAFFMVSIVISNAVLFNLFNLIYNGEFVTAGYGDKYYPIYAGIVLIAMVVAMILVFFTNSYFIIKKTKEVAIATLSGRSPGEIASMIGYQNVILLGISLVIGFAFGIIIMPLFLLAMYSALGIQGSIFAFSLEGLLYTLMVVVMEFIWIILINVGFAFRREIKDLMSEQEQRYTPFVEKFKIPAIIYWIGLLLPYGAFAYICFGEVVDTEKILYMENVISFSTSFACVFIIFYIPRFLTNLKKKKGFKNKILLMVTSNLQYSIRKAGYIVGILLLTSVNFIVIASKSADAPLVKMLAITALVVVLILLSLVLIYKVAIEAENRKRGFKQLLLVGYTLDEIRRIIVKEIGWFYGIVITIPVSYIALLCVAAIQSRIMTISFAINCVGAFLLIMLISYGASMIIYKKIVIGYLKNSK
ncbi:MAG: hypothetical protein ACRC2K_01825 [Clostridium sp.]